MTLPYATQQKITDVKRLTNISDVRLLSVCVQTVDQHIGTKRKRKFNENQENDTLGECKQLSQEKSQTFVRYVGQQTVVRCFSAQTVAWADLYPFAVRTSDVRLLSVCCPKLFAVLCGEMENVGFTLPLVWQVVVFYIYWQNHMHT